MVALGENTHGTRDFFEMKARILRFLVEEMGFDAFAIEATWPESNRLDRYWPSTTSAAIWATWIPMTCPRSTPSWTA